MYARDEALIATPIGMVRVTGDDHVISAIRIEPGRATPMTGQAHAVRETARQISEYFAGVRTHFDLPLAPVTSPRGAALRLGIIDINIGNTISYGELAERVGSSPRAVGQACARNPFPIVVPCHRVTGSNGAVGNYSGGEGITTKIWLLDHERRHAEILI
jgi:methylated-DNA-[protein]-cysteine S-methyltransferase